MENKLNSISLATLHRLPKYLRILKSTTDDTISSTKIAEELNLSAIQVRKDLATVSKSEGKPKIGFEVKDLISDIEEYLNLNKSKDIIVVGAGRLGQALMNYTGFENDVNIKFAFDVDRKKCDNKKIFHNDRLDELVMKNNIHVAIITVPRDEAQKMCDNLVSLGIKAIWNFAPVNLKVPSDITIRNEDLSASLAVLLNRLNIK